MNPNYYYNAQKQNYIPPPLKENQELLMQRNLYYTDNKGQQSQALYGMMSNQNILNSQVYQQQQQQANLNVSPIQNINLSNQQLPIPQDVNSTTKLKYVDSLQRLPSDSGQYQGVTGGQSNSAISQEWLTLNGINQNINNTIAISHIHNNQPPGQTLVDSTQKVLKNGNKDNSRTPNFQNAGLPIQQQPQSLQQAQINNRNQKINKLSVSVAIDKNNLSGENSSNIKLSPTQQNLANSIIQYKKGVMEGTTKPDPTFEKYIKQCYGLLTHQEQVEINKFIQNFQKSSPLSDSPKLSQKSTFSPQITKNVNNYLTNNKNKPPPTQQTKINNETLNKKSVISTKTKNSIKKLTKHDLNSLKYMIDSREKFDDLFYRRFLPAKYKYFSPLQIMGKNIDYYDIYSLLSFVGFEKVDTVDDSVWDHIIRTLHIFPDPPRIRSLLKSHCLPVFQPFNEFILNGFTIPPDEVETTNENQPILTKNIPIQNQPIISKYTSSNSFPPNQIQQSQFLPNNVLPSSNQLPQSIPQSKPQLQQSLTLNQQQQQQTIHYSKQANYNNTNNTQTQPSILTNKDDNTSIYGSINPIFKNYEPKIKIAENLRDEELNVIDKYVTDPEVKGVEELGLITSHSLEMQLKSGLDTEITHALNTLSIISSDLYTNFSLVEDPELVYVMTEMLEDCLKKFKLISMDEDIISFEKLYDMEMDDFEQVYAPTVHGKTLKEEEKIKNRSLCLGNIFRNLSFIPDNQILFANNTKLLEVILTTFKIQCDAHYLQERNNITNNELSTNSNSSCNNNDSELYSETATCILEHRKNGIIFFSNISAYVKIPNEVFAKTLITILEDVIVHSDDSFYSYPALEAIGKLGIMDSNKHKLSSVLLDWDNLVNYIMSLLPLDGLSLDVEPEDVAQIEILMLNLYNICTFDDELKFKIANRHGFISSMLKLSLYPNDFTNFLIHRYENNQQALAMYDPSVFSNSRCQFYIQTLTPICQRAMRILHEISLLKETRPLFYPYETKLIEISMLNINVVNKEISQLAGEILSTLQEKDLEFYL